MSHKTVTALSSRLSPHVALGKSRRETLSLLIVAMISARTVNLSHLACARGGGPRCIDLPAAAALLAARQPSRGRVGTPDCAATWGDWPLASLPRPHELENRRARRQHPDAGDHDATVSGAIAVSVVI